MRRPGLPHLPSPQACLDPSNVLPLQGAERPAEVNHHTPYCHLPKHPHNETQPTIAWIHHFQLQRHCEEGPYHQRWPHGLRPGASSGDGAWKGGLRGWGSYGLDEERS